MTTAPTPEPTVYHELANALSYDACMIAETAAAASLVVSAADDSAADLDRMQELLTTVQFQLENIKRQAMALANRIDNSQFDYTLKKSTPPAPLRAVNQENLNG
jgi:hypothetical protein